MEHTSILLIRQLGERTTTHHPLWILSLIMRTVAILEHRAQEYHHYHHIVTYLKTL